MKSLYVVNRVALTQSSWSGNIDKALSSPKSSIGYFTSGGMSAFLTNSFPHATLVPFDAASRLSAGLARKVARLRPLCVIKG